MVFSVAQSLNPKSPKFPKLVGAPKTFGNVGFPCAFLDFQQKSKKTHGNFWMFSRNPKKPWKFLDFQQKSKKAHGNFWMLSRNPKKPWKFLDFQQKSKKTRGNPKFQKEIQNFKKKSKFSKTIGRTKIFRKFWISMCFFGFSTEAIQNNMRKCIVD